MILEQISVGGDRNFAYVLGADGVGAVIDPSYDPDRVVDRAEALGLVVRYVINTHGHTDHTNGNERALARTDAIHVAHPGGGLTPTLAAGHGDTLDLGGFGVTLLETPGHSPDSIVVVAGDAAITGDTLFVGKVGGTRTEADGRAQYRSLHEVLLALPDETRVFPGHDVGVRPSSTIGDERRTNPFLLQPDVDAFLHLKANWAAYKKEHGIA